MKNWIFATFVLFSGCTHIPEKTPTADYFAAQGRPAGRLRGNSEAKAVAAVKSFLGNLTEENVLRSTRRIYAPDAYFNDTLKTVIGAPAIEEYLLASVANTEKIAVRVEDVARSGKDYYFRWVMDVKFRSFARGRTVRTVGITHVRFNPDGLIVLHQDYWDSTQGLFEYVPVIGPGIRFIKSRL